MSTVLLKTYWAPMAAGRGGGNQISETPQSSGLLPLAEGAASTAFWKLRV